MGNAQLLSQFRWEEPAVQRNLMPLRVFLDTNALISFLESDRSTPAFRDHSWTFSSGAKE